MEEIWKDVDGYNGVYRVSSEGRILSTNFNRSKKNKLMKQTLDSNKYLVVVLMNKGKRKKISVHRLVANAFIDNKENKPTVNHKNNNPEDNRVENLEWATFKENTNHAWQNGLCENVKKAQKRNLIKAQNSRKKKILDIKNGVVYDSAKKAYLKTEYSYTHFCKLVRLKQINFRYE